ncbi:MAG TPA: hypothetical protein VF893_08060 [Candidatus Bathyarchaeia archaeon]
MIKLRLDVDYAYPSRMKSFVFTTLSIRTRRDYLKNSKIIAKMINESPREVKAYWFFTPYTTPDSELLELLTPEKHEVALHVANNPYRELEQLERATSRKVRYYTVHGTARLLARLMWKRKLWEPRAPIPDGFPLKSFYEFPTLGFDLVCYNNPPSEAAKIGEKSIEKGDVLHVHPEWLFQQGTFNHRGPFYNPLRQILRVDKEFDALLVRKKVFARMAKFAETKEYEQDFVPTERFIEKLGEKEIDIFTFLERNWCCPIQNSLETWVKAEDNIALLNVTTYNAWLERVGKKTRNMIRKAEKSGVSVRVVEPDDKLAEGIWKIYNETPTRQGRSFPHFGQSLEIVKEMLGARTADTYIAAFLNDECVGFIQLVHGDRITIISQILSLQEHSDKAVNNALVAKAIEFCAGKQFEWIMYGRMGNHPSLDNFKENNGFSKFLLARYFIPVTRKGRIAIKLGLHQELKDVLPQGIKYRLIPFYNWASRNMARIK